MADEDTQAILDYTARDFDTIRSMLVGIGKGLYPEWTTIGEANDFGTLLLEEYAYMGDIMNFYIDRVASEAFLGTAQRRQSVLFIAEQQGYSPIGQRAAIVALTFTLDVTFPAELAPLTVPAGTRVYTSADNSADVVYFETDTALVLKVGESATVSATEGRASSGQVGASTGAPNQTFQIADLGVIEGTVKVRSLEGSYTFTDPVSADSPQWVNWYEVPAIAASRPTQSVYATYIDDQSYTYVLFGDGASGRIPPTGAQIEISYRYGVGAKGNSVGVTTLVNLDQGGSLPVQYLTVVNSDSPIGGADPESLDSMRFSIPKGSQIRERAVTVDDYQSLAMQVPGVSKAAAYGQVYSAVNVQVAPVGGNMDDPDLMAILRQNVQNYLEPRILIGSKVYVENATWTDIWIKLDLHILDGFDQDQTEASVMQAIRDALAFDNMDMGESVHIGEIYRHATRVEGVDWVNITALNAANKDSTVVTNIDVPFGSIARIALDPTPDDTTNDDTGLTITSYGGTVTG